VVLEPSRDEFNDSPLPPAEHPCLVQGPLSKRQYRPPCDLNDRQVSLCEGQVREFP
jgi:hypothetical protein